MAKGYIVIAGFIQSSTKPQTRIQLKDEYLPSQIIRIHGS